MKLSLVTFVSPYPKMRSIRKIETGIELRGRAPNVAFVALRGRGSTDILSRTMADYLMRFFPRCKVIYAETPQRKSPLYRYPYYVLEFIFNLYKQSDNGIIHLPSQELGRYIHFMRPAQRVMVHVHDILPVIDPSLMQETGMLSKLSSSIDLAGLRLANHLISTSNYVRKDLVRLSKIPENKISVVYNGVDRSIFYPRKNAYPDFPLRNKRYLLYVGSQVPKKNLPTLIKTFAVIKKHQNFTDLKLALIGSAGGTKFKENTSSLISRLGLRDDVLMLEHLPQEVLPFFYSFAQVFVLTSYYEGFSLCPPEAMACGTPVIASKIPGNFESVGDAGILVDDPFDHEEFAEAIINVIENPSLRTTLILKGFAFVRRFDWLETARQVVNVYHKLWS